MSDYATNLEPLVRVSDNVEDSVVSVTCSSNGINIIRLSFDGASWMARVTSVFVAAPLWVVCLPACSVLGARVIPRSGGPASIMAHTIGM